VRSSGDRPPAGPAAGAALAILILATAWSGLVADAGSGHLLGLCVAAALPAVAALSPRAPGPAALVATVLAVPLALGLALRRSAWDLLTLDGEAWSAARAILPDGLRQGSGSGLPVSPAELPELAALLDMALVALVATAAWQILVRRRPVAGLVAVGVGLAYRWTVEPPAQSVVAGGLALAALAAVLALASWEGGGADRAFRRLGGAVVLGGASVALAASLGSGPAQAGDAWWGWKDWELGGSDRTGATLDFRQRYGTLDWPDEPRVALTVDSPRALPLRAVSLDEFDGISFAAAGGGGGPSQPLPVVHGVIRAGDDLGAAGDRLTQRVTLTASSSQLVLASGRPQRIRGPFTGASLTLGDAVRVDDRLQPGDRYTVDALVPQPTPGELVAARAYDPAEAPPGETRLRATLWSDPVVDVPLWGSGGRPPADPGLGPYAPVRELARSVAGDAATPYAAVNRIESFLRQSYVYDEAPPFPTSLPAGTNGGWPENRPPLVDFLLNSRRGFCQQFAGGMAVMLRSLGIPARVAVGYTGGRFDPERDAYVVHDRDAHSWVEVWFPDHGWIPFDPTPGRSVPNPASVSSPDYAPSRIDVSVSGLAGQAVGAAEDTRPPTPVTPVPEPEPDPVAAPVAAGGGGRAVWLWTLVGLAALLCIAPAARAGRRLRHRRAGDERARTVAAARDLEAALAALGWAPDPSASTGERAARVRARTGVDPAALYRRAARARFDPTPPPAGSAAAAWREARRLRRAIARRAPWRRRLVAALGLTRPWRGTVGRWTRSPRPTRPTATASGS
jgi:transglutaminase-like putative cysteine protease